MGVLAYLYLFDVDRFERTIVPALKQGRDNSFLRDHLKLLPELSESFIDTIPIVAAMLDARFQLVENDSAKMKIWWYEDYCRLLETLITSHCLISEPNLYISKRSLKFVFEACGQDTFAYQTMCKLDGPIFWTHSSGGYHEGIRAWIDPLDVSLCLEVLSDMKIREDYSECMHYLPQLKILLSEAARLNVGILNGGELRFL